MDDAIVIHALNNLDSQFWPYFTILNHEARQKAQLPTLSELTKSLEDEELRLKNESTASANFAKKAKSKSASHGNRTNTGKKSTKDLDQKKNCKTCGSNHNGDCRHLTAECFQCHETGHISANCPENNEKGSTSSGASNNKSTTSENSTAKGKAKKMNCFSRKILSKDQPEQALAFSSITYCQQQSLTTSIIIDSGATDHFFTNKDLITNYREHRHVFETGSGEKVIAHGYGDVILQYQSLDGTINTLTVSNVSCAPDLGHNLLSTIPLAKKGIEIFLRRTGRPSEIFFEDEVVGLADMIENQYVIRLARSSVPKMNVVKNPTPEIWHARLGHLSYGAMQILVSVASGMELKGPIPSEIYGGCMVGRQQRQPSRESPSRRATEFLEFVHSDLGGPLPATRLGQTFYISFYSDSTGCYYIDCMRHKSQAFERFVKFVTWAQNQSRNKLKRYRTDFGGEFDNKLFKT